MIDELLIDIAMPIETERLIIKPPETGDGRALHEAVQETWEDLNTWMLWAKDRDQATEDFYEGYVREQAALFIQRKNIALLAFEKASGKLVASTGLHRYDWELRNFEIGYWVRKAAQGQGYATEIARVLTVFAFNELKARTVLICHADGNDRSQNVIQKLGFEKAGVIPNGILLPSGEAVKHHIYSRVDTQNL